MANIVVAQQRPIQVNSNNTTGIIQTNVPVVLKNNTNLVPLSNSESVTDIVLRTLPTSISAIVTPSRNSVYIKNDNVWQTQAPTSTVEDLLDVNIVSKVNGATLVYDVATDTFLIEPINYADISGSLSFSDISGVFSGNVDGGTF